MENNKNKHAFPHNSKGGLTKREYFAVKLMAALLSGGDWSSRLDTYSAAEMALKCTDELLKQLEEDTCKK